MTSAGQPNAHGVYEPAEVLALPNLKPGWRGAALAEIRLLELADGWRFSVAANTNTRGRCGPITNKARAFPTREAAVLAGADDLRRWLTTVADPQVAGVKAWLDTLIPEQPDLFGAAA